MRQDDTASGWEIGQQISYRSSEPDRPGGVPTAREPAAEAGSQVPVLARLPDLDTPRPSRRRTRRPRSSPKSDGRIISQGLSMKLLGGGALILVALAVVPWLLGGKGEQPSGKPELPAWEQDESVPVASQAPEYGPDDAGSEAPLRELTESDWPEAPSAPSITGVQVAEQPADRGSARRPSVPDRQANDPAAPAGPGAWAMRPVQLGAEPASPSGPLPGSPPPGYGQPGSCDHCPDHRAPSRPRDPANWQQPPRSDVAPQGGQRVPGSTYDTPPGTAARAPGPEPGVARLQGIIEGTPVRTTYERSRSGIY